MSFEFSRARGSLGRQVSALNAITKNGHHLELPTELIEQIMRQLTFTENWEKLRGDNENRALLIGLVGEYLDKCAPAPSQADIIAFWPSTNILVGDIVREFYSEPMPRLALEAPNEILSDYLWSNAVPMPPPTPWTIIAPAAPLIQAVELDVQCNIRWILFAEKYNLTRAEFPPDQWENPTFAKTNVGFKYKGKNGNNNSSCNYVLYASRRIKQRDFEVNNMNRRIDDKPAMELFYDMDGDPTRCIKHRVFNNFVVNAGLTSEYKIKFEQFYDVDGDESRRIKSRDITTFNVVDGPVLAAVLGAAVLRSNEKFYDVDGDESCRIEERAWHVDGKLTRLDDKPAIEKFYNKTGDESQRIEARAWYVDGKQTRLNDKPAIETFYNKTGDESQRIEARAWYVDGKHSRLEDKPAIEKFYNKTGDESRRIQIRQWCVDGKLTRLNDKPAVERFYDVDGDESRRIELLNWATDGSLYRAGDKPPVVQFYDVDGNKSRRTKSRMWYSKKEDERHRIGGPAVEEFHNDGVHNLQSRIWYKHGALHRAVDDGPAIEQFDESGALKSRVWLSNGQEYGSEGPATEIKNGVLSYITCHGDGDGKGPLATCEAPAPPLHRRRPGRKRLGVPTGAQS
jgi:hypothetical protein